MAFLLEATLDPDADAQAPPGRPGAHQRPEPSAPTRPMSLHISKLRGITNQIRRRLKRQGITYTHQLIEAAHDQWSCGRLAALSGLDGALLERLVRRADLARINGIGAIFADMLEVLGVDCSLFLARQDPVALHAALCRLNAREHLARRAPTPEEVQSWIRQAAALSRGPAGEIAAARASGNS